MNFFIERVYYRIQSLYTRLVKVKIRERLGLADDFDYRVDLLRTMEPIRATLPACDVLIDIGANKGEFSQIFSSVLKSSLIVAVEPNEDLNADIKEKNSNCELVIVNKAVSDRETQMDFYFHTDTQMSSLFSANESMIRRDFLEDNAAQTTKRSIDVTTLDHIYQLHEAKLNSKTIFLKIDTQGNEMDVIRGGQEMLKNVSYCLLEYMFQSPYETQYSFEELISLMDRNKFKCLGPANVSHRTTGEIGAVLFLFRKVN